MSSTENLEKSFEVAIILLTLLSATNLQFITFSWSTEQNTTTHEYLVNNLSVFFKLLSTSLFLSISLWFISIFLPYKFLFIKYLLQLNAWYYLGICLIRNVAIYFWIILYPLIPEKSAEITMIKNISGFIGLLLWLLTTIKYDTRIKLYIKNDKKRYSSYIVFLVILFSIAVYI
jgi:hypothetical protein